MYIQVGQGDTEDVIIDDEEVLDEETSMPCSTKRPITDKGPKETKRQKRENQEQALLQKAITCMETASASTSSTVRDADTVFGEYIASELRALQNTEMKRWLKHRIQSLIFSTTSTFPSATPEMSPHQFGPSMMQAAPVWEYPRGNRSREYSSTPCYTSSTPNSVTSEYREEYDEHSFSPN